MMTRKSLVLVGLVAAEVLLATSAFAARPSDRRPPSVAPGPNRHGATFTGIGFIQEPGPLPASQVWDMNADGTLFLVSPSPWGAYLVKWTREGGWGDHVGQTDGGQIRLSNLGDTVMGNGKYPGSNPPYAWAGTWTGAFNEWIPLPAQPGFAPCGNSRLSFHDMAGEGDYATGLTWYGCAAARAFRWDKETDTTIDLGSPNGRATRGNAITTDGSKVIGFGTPIYGTRRAVVFEYGTATFLGDPNGTEPWVCVTSGNACTVNSADPKYGCPEYVDDASCPSESRGICTGGVCIGGFDAGGDCTSNDQCGGSCAGGPNEGQRCTYDEECPDTPVCVDNPNWTDDLYKGEAYDMTDDGRYVCGQHFDFGDKWDTGWRANPDGSFTEIPPPESWPYTIEPFRISQDGSTVVGYAGDRVIGTIPIFWREGLGTIDLQYFLVAQGLDDLLQWYLIQASTLSADGTIIGGYGANPDRVLEGWIVDLKNVWVCHAPGGDTNKPRTLGVDIASAADHVAHGDFLGTCEFLDSIGESGLDDGPSKLDELNARRRAAAESTAGPERVGSAIEAWEPEVQAVVERHAIAAPAGKLTRREH